MDDLSPEEREGIESVLGNALDERKRMTGALAGLALALETVVAGKCQRRPSGRIDDGGARQEEQTA